MAMFVDSKDTTYACCIAAATANVRRDIVLAYLAARGSHLRRAQIKYLEHQCLSHEQHGFRAGACNKVEGAWETGGQVYFEDLTATASAPVESGRERQPEPQASSLSPSRQTAKPSMAWTEGTGWMRGGSLAWQLYDAAGKADG